MMGAVEALSLIPGADTVLGSEENKTILVGAITQTVAELEALFDAKTVDQMGFSDIYAVFHNTLKSTVDGMLATAATTPAEGPVKKLLEWLAVGGEKALKTVMALPGTIAKGGSLANRAFRLVRPHSLMEYYIVAPGYPEDTLVQHPLAIDQKIDGMALYKHGNVVNVMASGTVYAGNASWSISDLTQDCQDLGDFRQCTVTVKESSFAEVCGFSIAFSSPTEGFATGAASGDSSYTARWLGYRGVTVAYSDALGSNWVHETVPGRNYQATGCFALPGSTFTAAVGVRVTTYDANNEQTGYSILTYDYILNFQ